MTRVLPLLGPLVLAVVGCGGEETDSGADGNDPYASCKAKGSLAGCELFEGTDCQGNTALDGLKGGWFDDSGSDLVIGFDRTPAGLDLRMTIPNASGVSDGTELSIPTEVLVDLTDKSGTAYYACAGTLRITNYTAGDLLWANATLQARGPMGVCGETDFYTLAVELVNAELCAP